MKHYDLIVIGSGGGSKLRPAADMGHKMAIIEKDELGGTCLNRGCIPSKMLIHPAEELEAVSNWKKYHLKLTGSVKADFETLVTQTNQTVQDYSKGIGEFYSKHKNIDWYRGKAQFLSDKVLEVKTQKLTANRIFIATGSRPFIPPIEGLTGTPFMTSKEALKNTKLPKKMIVIGGGYIASELGYFYGMMGTEMDFVVRGNMLEKEDIEVRKQFQKVFGRKFNLYLQHVTEKVEYSHGEFSVHITHKRDHKKRVLKADALLLATGVIPNTDQLDLKNTGVKTDSKGWIQVNDHLETSVKGVYALGDVIGRHLFRHSVNFEGEYLLDTLYQNPSGKKIHYPPVPHAVFSSPQVAGVGKTEQELKKEGIEFIIGKNDYKDSAMGGDAMKMDHGFVKLLFDKKTRKLLGAHIIGPEASNMIHTPIAFMNMGATLEDILRTIYIHPALPEVVRNAARKAKLKF